MTNSALLPSTTYTLPNVTRCWSGDYIPQAWSFIPSLNPATPRLTRLLRLRETQYFQLIRCIVSSDRNVLCKVTVQFFPLNCPCMQIVYRSSTGYSTQFKHGVARCTASNTVMTCTLDPKLRPWDHLIHTRLLSDQPWKQILCAHNLTNILDIKVHLGENVKAFSN